MPHPTALACPEPPSQPPAFRDGWYTAADFEAAVTARLAEVYPVWLSAFTRAAQSPPDGPGRALRVVA